MKPWIKYLNIYEPGKPIEEVARELGFSEIDDIIKVASNENEWGPSPKAIKAIKDNASLMHRYPDGGSYYLRNHLANHLDVNANQIIFGNGSNEIIVFLAHLFLEPNKELIMSEKAFAVYALATKLFQGDLIQVPMNNFTHDLDAIFEAITPNTRLVTIVNPNNPTGTAVDPNLLIDFIKSVPRDIIVILDEAYYEIMPKKLRGDSISLIRNGVENLIILRTFSKGHGLAGLRIGYGISNNELISNLNRIRQPFNINLMAQKAAIAAIDDIDHIEKTYKGTQDGCEYLTHELIEMGFDIVPTAANFILVKTYNGRKWFEHLQKHKIIVRAMDAYGLPDYIRITVGKYDQNKLILEAMSKLKNLI